MLSRTSWASSFSNVVSSPGLRITTSPGWASQIAKTPSAPKRQRRSWWGMKPTETVGQDILETPFEALFVIGHPRPEIGHSRIPALAFAAPDPLSGHDGTPAHTRPFYGRECSGIEAQPPSDGDHRADPRRVCVHPARVVLHAPAQKLNRVAKTHQFSFPIQILHHSIRLDNIRRNCFNPFGFSHAMECPAWGTTSI